MKKIITLVLLTFSPLSFSFDLEDYATTYRSTKDAYLKAANEFSLAYGNLQNLNNLYKVSCFKVSGSDYENIAGLHSGACNEDGKLTYVSGGVARTGVSFGDNIAAIINITPLPLDLPNLKLEDTNTLRSAKRVEQYDAAEAAINITITKDLSCVPAKKSLATAPAEALAAHELRYKDVYAAYYRAAAQLQSSIGPYKAAFEAYKTATSVYQAVAECEGIMGITDHENYEPYNAY